MTKRIIALILAVMMLAAAFSMTASAARTIRNVNDAMALCREGDLCEVRRGTLYRNGKNSGRIYVVVLHGSNMSFNPVYLNSMECCALTAFSLPSRYFFYAKDKILDKVPKGANIAFIGHSLGGMVAQELAADPQIIVRYNVVNTLTMGSPYITELTTEGSLHRMADSGDAVPYLSPNIPGNFLLGNYTYGSNGYFGDPDGAHNVSYAQESFWRNYDCFGVEGGKSYIVLA